MELIKQNPWLIIVGVAVFLLIWYLVMQAYENKRYKRDVKGGLDAIEAQNEIIKNPEIDKEAKKMVNDHKNKK